MKLEVVQRHGGDNLVGVIVPDTLYINDVEVLLPENAKIEISPLTNRECVTATVTFFVGELTVRAEKGA